jgi:hypothetical protein
MAAWPSPNRALAVRPNDPAAQHKGMGGLVQRGRSRWEREAWPVIQPAPGRGGFVYVRPGAHAHSGRHRSIPERPARTRTSLPGSISLALRTAPDERPPFRSERLGVSLLCAGLPLEGLEEDGELAPEGAQGIEDVVDPVISESFERLELAFADGKHARQP